MDQISHSMGKRINKTCKITKNMTNKCENNVWAQEISCYMPPLPCIMLLFQVGQKSEIFRIFRNIPEFAIPEYSGIFRTGIFATPEFK